MRVESREVGVLACSQKRKMVFQIPKEGGVDMCKKLIVLCLMLAATATIASASKITYVDATHGATGNTTVKAVGGTTYGLFDVAENGGTGLRPATDARNGTDNLWWLRKGLANPIGNGTVYESRGSYSQQGNTEDSPRLCTTVTGLPEGTYKVYAYFWSDVSQWRIRAKLNGSTTYPPLYRKGSVAPELEVNPADPNAVMAWVGDFSATVLTKEGNRELWQAYLGDVTGTGFSVYVDDDIMAPSDSDGNLLGDYNQRSWYDGVGYIPEPMTVTLLGLGGLALLRRKRA